MACPSGDVRINCYDLEFASGLRLSQKNKLKHRICKVYFRLSSPPASLENNNVVIEGACQEILACKFRSKSGDSTSGEAAACQFNLATSCQAWTAVRISMSKKDFSTMEKTHREWAYEPCRLAVEGPRRTSANDPNIPSPSAFHSSAAESKHSLFIHKGCLRPLGLAKKQLRY